MPSRRSSTAPIPRSPRLAMAISVFSLLALPLLALAKYRTAIGSGQRRSPSRQRPYRCRRRTRRDQPRWTRPDRILRALLGRRGRRADRHRDPAARRLVLGPLSADQRHARVREESAEPGPISRPTVAWVQQAITP